MVAEALKLPNKTHPDSPTGDESQNLVLKTFDEVKDSGHRNESLEDGLTHLEIASQFDLLDFQNASKLTGNKFVLYRNEAALLELALCNWALNLVAKKGFTPITPPDLARQHIVEGCGFQPRDDSS